MIKISLKFVPKGPINNIPALVQIMAWRRMAWRRPGDKPISGPMMVSLLTHICVTRPQWVKSCAYFIRHIVFAILILNCHQSDNSVVDDCNSYCHNINFVVASDDDVIMRTLLSEFLFDRIWQNSSFLILFLFCSLLMFQLNDVLMIFNIIQGSPFLKIITCPTPRILKFFDLLIWNKEEKSVQIHLPHW